MVNCRLIGACTRRALKARIYALTAVALVIAGCNVLNAGPQIRMHTSRTTHATVTQGQLGIDVLWYYDHVDTTSDISAKANATFRYVRYLGGNSVSVAFPFYMASFRASKVDAGYGTPSVAQLAMVVRLAHRYRLRVTVRPILDGVSLGPGHWRGTIMPRSRREWFASYLAFLRPYLAMARATGAEEFEIGVEFNSLTGDPHWGPLLAAASRIYHGVIGYDSNWDIFQQGALAPLPVISQGVDAYFPTTLADNASVAQIIAALNSQFVQMPAGIDFERAVITEIGIPAQDGAYAHPYGRGNGLRPINATIQERWFAAACVLMREWRMAGIYYWSLDLNKPPGSFDPASALPTSFVDRGSAAIRACFRSGRQLIPAAADGGAHP